jgi:hypothetical protein
MGGMGGMMGMMGRRFWFDIIISILNNFNKFQLIGKK